MSDRDLQDLDRSVLWHPFTQQQGWAGEDFPVIDHADDTTQKEDAKYNKSIDPNTGAEIPEKYLDAPEKGRNHLA